jgi:putative radical SAM enzyme (TIGR03279 family)
MLKIAGVESGSIGEELGLEVGDSVIAINNRPIWDLLDYQVYTATEHAVLEVARKDGEIWELDVEKDSSASLGLLFEHPEPAQCGNNCIFCFVHQLPRGMRSTLYVKDEDYRFSYLYGSYVTLTNIDQQAIARIIDQQLSPLYVSVHATDESLRTRLIGRQGISILDLLERLTQAGIKIHTQIVLCPGINDGPQMEKTVEDLYRLHPGVMSLAVVPVGLTGHRHRLPDLRPPTLQEAGETIDLLQRYQEAFLRGKGSRFVFAADELYILAGRDFPPLDAYEDLPQLENGIGMVPVFRSEAEEVLTEADVVQAPRVSTFSGESFFPELARFASRLAGVAGVDIRIYEVRNDFFGGHVTVTGLLTGRDIIRQLSGKELGEVLLVPDVVFREGDDLFLDDLSLADLETELQVRVKAVASTPWGLLEALEELADEYGGENEGN